MPPANCGTGTRRRDFISPFGAKGEHQHAIKTASLLRVIISIQLPTTFAIGGVALRESSRI